MKKILYSLIFAFALTTFFACERDPIDKNNSILNIKERPMTEFDYWLRDNFLLEYNIRLLYRFEDMEANPRFNLLPTRLRNAEVMAQIIRHVWLDAYDEVAGPDFTRRYSPRLVKLIGSNAYLEHGRILGTAEGGLKVTLFNVNTVDEHNLNPVRLNNEFFHTIHHEVGHILHQTRMFSEDFQAISNAYYVMGSWHQYSLTEALRLGFITQYSRFNHYEDFVELYSFFITNTPEEWARRLAIARTGAPPSAPIGVTGYHIINLKMSIVQAYFRDAWGLCIVQMRDVTLRRSAEVPTLEFLTFNR